MNTKKILGVVAVLALVAVAMVGAGAAAVSDTDVAKIDNTGYATLQEAINAAVEGNTIVLLQNIVLTETAIVDMNGAYDDQDGFTIDLNGKDITSNNVRALWIKDGYVTLIDSTGGNHSVSSTFDAISSSSVIRVGSNNALDYDNDTEKYVASLIIGTGTTDSVIINGTKCYGVSVFNNNGTQKLDVRLNEGSKIITVDGTALSGAGNTVYDDNDHVTFYIKGEIRATKDANYVGDPITGVYMPGEGTVTIGTNAKVTGEDSAVEIRSGKLSTTNILGNTATLESLSTNYSCNHNGDGTTTSGVAVAIAEHTTGHAINAVIKCELISGTDNLISVANPENLSGDSYKEQRLDLYGKEYSVYFDTERLDDDKTAVILADNAKLVTEETWDTVKDYVKFATAGTEIQAEDATKVLNSNYNNYSQESSVPIDNCVNNGTAVSLDIGFSYVFTIPPTVGLSDTEDGSKNAEFTFTATQKLEGYNAVVSVLTKGQGNNNDEYYVKAGTKTATYVLNENTESGTDNLTQGSEILDVDLDSDNTGNKTIYFITTVLPGFSGNYTGTIEFNAEIVQDVN